MTDLWIPPSDELLMADGIAKAKIDNPHDEPDLHSAGILLPESDDDAALEAAAAVALAEMDDGEPEGELVAVDDDEDVEDLDDTPVGADL